mgnify:CR=1 FL=1
MHLNNLQPQSNQTSLFLKEPFFSKIQRFENYDGFFIPVLSNKVKTADFITIDKNNSNDFCLHETERVNSLLVENLSNKPLLILNGEIFDGAKQDRVANETVLIPDNSAIEIKVSCVEQGRWAYKTKAFSRGKNMFNYHSKGVKDLHNNSVKHNQPSGSIQDNVWTSIHDKQMRMGVSSRTGSINDTYERFEESLSGLRKKIIEEELAVPVITGKKSEKDKFVGAVETNTLESLMPDGKALQMGTSHFLGQNFSKPFDVKYLDESNNETFAWQTSWGVSWRLIGGMIMTHGDDKGLVLPPKLAPIQVVIIPIYYSKEEKDSVMQKARQIKDDLSKIDLRVHLDDREQLTPGFKFNDWEMKGIPIRIEIGPKDIAKKQVVLARRHNRTKTSVNMDSLTEEISSELKNIQKEMFDAAKKILDERIVRVSEYQQFKEQLDNGKMIDCSWCGNQTCEDKIKEETGADIRVIPSDNTKAETCIYCKNSGTANVLFARGY